MKEDLLRRNHARLGQALPAAVITLSVLLVLGLVFIGIIGRNIRQVGEAGARNASDQLALAGLRYAHSQLVNSELRADWRPAFTPLSAAGDTTKDPDAFYLRPGSGYGFSSTGDPVKDLGGPDGLGPFSRSAAPNGRELIRVRYAPSDPNILASTPSQPGGRPNPSTGSLKEPGRARNYLIIESVGREGRIDPNDPTTLIENSGVKYRNFTSEADFRAAFDSMKDRDSRVVSSRKLIGFASIGIIDYARYITDKDETTRPADLGMDSMLGATFGTLNVQVPMQIGGTYQTSGSTVDGGGSIFSNADLRFFGTVNTVLNPSLGDGIFTAGKTIGADDAARLNIVVRWGDNTSTTGDANLTLDNPGSVSGTLNSASPNFLTQVGLIRDGDENTDRNGYARSVGRREPPSVLSQDASTQLNTYLTITRNSGRIYQFGNSGRWGHGSNTYVANYSDLQMRSDETGRADMGASESLVNDILNPNNGLASSGWQGPFYVPRGAVVHFNYDGWTVTKDGRAPNNERTWRNPDGSNTTLTTIRYRLGDPDGAGPLGLYIIDSLTNPADIDSANPNWTNGLPFGGVMYFEGNARVRGVIPTDTQITMISMGSIFIEGSLVKGNVAMDTGAVLTRPSRSELMLIAKDYVVLNTTQFFGAGNAALSERSEDVGPDANNPLVVPASKGSFNLQSEFMMRNEQVTGLPAVTPDNPSTWRPYAMDYLDCINNNPLTTKLLLSHAMSDGAGSNAFVGLEINRGLGTSTYMFDCAPDQPGSNVSHNSAYGIYGLNGFSPIEGIGHLPYQTYPQYETLPFNLIRPAGTLGASTWPNGNPFQMTGASNEGTWSLMAGGVQNIFNVFTTNLGSASTNDYIFRRAAIVPQEIRVEASMYAENGSFLVVPGRWFNNNPNDRRDIYDTNAWGATTAEKNLYRLTHFGSSAETPFYGEPLDVKVTIFGALSENMPAPVQLQTEWSRKWGWIPHEHGSSGDGIPTSHVPAGWNPNDPTAPYVPNLTIIYDPTLATGRTTGFVDLPGSYIRSERYVPDPVGNPGFSVELPLPPMPRLPVSPTLAYFGEVSNP